MHRRLRADQGLPLNAPDPIALSRARRQFQRAEAYLAANDPAAAANAFEAVLQELPGHVPALLKLSALHLMAGRYTPAEQLTMRALREPMESPGLTLQLIGQLRAGACREIGVRPEATADFEAARAEAAKKSIWATGCKSWYLDKHGVPASWPWTPSRFFEEMASPHLEAYEQVG